MACCFPIKYVKGFDFKHYLFLVSFFTQQLLCNSNCGICPLLFFLFFFFHSHCVHLSYPLFYPHLHTHTHTFSLMTKVVQNAVEHTPLLPLSGSLKWAVFFGPVWSFAYAGASCLASVFGSAGSCRQAVKGVIILLYTPHTQMGTYWTLPKVSAKLHIFWILPLVHSFERANWIMKGGKQLSDIFIIHSSAAISLFQLRCVSVNLQPLLSLFFIHIRN